MNHDSQTNDCDPTGFVMAAQASSDFTSVFKPPTEFSKCSEKYINDWFENTYGKTVYNPSCLENSPRIYENQEGVNVGPQCGNYIVEDGEDCDLPDADDDPGGCCDKQTCKFVVRNNVQVDCAGKSSLCCNANTCQFLPGGTLCNSAKNGLTESGGCDLNDYCTGSSGECEESSKRSGSECSYTLSSPFSVTISTMQQNLDLKYNSDGFTFTSPSQYNGQCNGNKQYNCMNIRRYCEIAGPPTIPTNAFIQLEAADHTLDPQGKCQMVDDECGQLTCYRPSKDSCFGEIPGLHGTFLSVPEYSPCWHPASENSPWIQDPYPSRGHYQMVGGGFDPVGDQTYPNGNDPILFGPQRKGQCRMGKCQLASGGLDTSLPSLCGNDIIEPYEQCDCGPDWFLRNNTDETDPCCDCTSCKLKDRNSTQEPHQCSIKDQCCYYDSVEDRCKFKEKDTVCRPESNSKVSSGCDVAETCTGKSAICPSDRGKDVNTVCYYDGKAEGDNDEVYKSTCYGKSCVRSLKYQCYDREVAGTCNVDGGGLVTDTDEYQCGILGPDVSKTNTIDFTRVNVASEYPKVAANQFCSSLKCEISSTVSNRREYYNIMNLNNGKVRTIFSNPADQGTVIDESTGKTMSVSNIATQSEVTIVSESNTNQYMCQDGKPYRIVTDEDTGKFSDLIDIQYGSGTSSMKSKCETGVHPSQYWEPSIGKCVHCDHSCKGCTGPTAHECVACKEPGATFDSRHLCGFDPGDSFVQPRWQNVLPWSVAKDVSEPFRVSYSDNNIIQIPDDPLVIAGQDTSVKCKVPPEPYKAKYFDLMEKVDSLVSPAEYNPGDKVVGVIPNSPCVAGERVDYGIKCGLKCEDGYYLPGVSIDPGSEYGFTSVSTGMTSLEGMSSSILRALSDDNTNSKTGSSTLLTSSTCDELLGLWNSQGSWPSPDQVNRMGGTEEQFTKLNELQDLGCDISSSSTSRVRRQLVSKLKKLRRLSKSTSKQGEAGEVIADKKLNSKLNELLNSLKPGGSAPAGPTTDASELQQLKNAIIYNTLLPQVDNVQTRRTSSNSTRALNSNDHHESLNRLLESDDDDPTTLISGISQILNSYNTLPDFQVLDCMSNFERLPEPPEGTNILKPPDDQKQLWQLSFGKTRFQGLHFPSIGKNNHVPRSCALKQCSCPNGIGRSGPTCPSHFQPRCMYCFPGYYAYHSAKLEEWWNTKGVIMAMIDLEEGKTATNGDDDPKTIKELYEEQGGEELDDLVRVDLGNPLHNVCAKPSFFSPQLGTDHLICVEPSIGTGAKGELCCGKTRGEPVKIGAGNYKCECKEGEYFGLTCQYKILETVPNLGYNGGGAPPTSHALDQKGKRITYVFRKYPDGQGGQDDAAQVKELELFRSQGAVQYSQCSPPQDEYGVIQRCGEWGKRQQYYCAAVAGGNRGLEEISGVVLGVFIDDSTPCQKKKIIRDKDNVEEEIVVNRPIGPIEICNEEEDKKQLPQQLSFVSGITSNGETYTTPINSETGSNFPKSCDCKGQTIQDFDYMMKPIPSDCKNLLDGESCELGCQEDDEDPYIFFPDVKTQDNLESTSTTTPIPATVQIQKPGFQFAYRILTERDKPTCIQGEIVGSRQCIRINKLDLLPPLGENKWSTPVSVQAERPQFSVKSEVVLRNFFQEKAGVKYDNTDTDEWILSPWNEESLESNVGQLRTKVSSIIIGGIQQGISEMIGKFISVSERRLVEFIDGVESMVDKELGKKQKKYEERVRRILSRPDLSNLRI